VIVVHRSVRFRSVRITRFAVLSVLLTGCYELEPVRGTAPQPGTQVAFDVTDVGRVALGGSMGPEIGQVEGRLIERDNGDYLLGVTSVSLLRGGVQVWKGEKVTFKPEYVGNIYERRLSKGRTFMFAAAGVSAVALIVSQNLLGSSNTQTDERKPDSSSTQRKPTFKIPLGSLTIPLFGRP